MLVVPSPISDSSVDASNFETGFGSVFGAFLFPGEPPLRFRQLLLSPGKIFWIANGFPCRESHHRCDAQIKPNHLSGSGKWVNMFLDLHGDEVAVGAILGNRDRSWPGSLGQQPMPDNLQRSIHLSRCEGRPIPREGIGGIGCRLLIALFL